MEETSYKVTKYLRIRSAREGKPGRDHCVFYISNTTGIDKLWVASAENKRFIYDIAIPWEGRIDDYTISTSKLIAFTTDYDIGNEFWGLYIDTGKSIIKISKGRDYINYLGSWNPAGTTLAFTSNKKDLINFDLYLYELGSLPRLVMRNKGILHAEHWIKGSKLLLTKSYTNLDSDILLYDIKMKRLYNLTGHNGEALNYSPIPINDKSFLFITNVDSEFKGIGLYNLESKRWKYLYNGEWDVDHVTLTGKTAYFTLNKNGESELYKISLEEGGEPSKIISTKGYVTRVEYSENLSQLIISLSKSEYGEEIFLLDENSGEMRKLTYSPKLLLSRKDFVRPEHFKYESFDGLTINGLLFKPKNGNKPYPGIMYLHGGPESQVTFRFNPLIQLLTRLGYLVIAPNFRGTIGYGKTFTHLDDIEKRGDAVKDVYYAYLSLVNEGLLDPSKVCVTGGSYGGYLTLMAMTFYPDIWKCGTEIAGIVNLVTFIRNTSPQRRKYRMDEYGDPDKHREIMLELSPITHIDKLKAPLMVIHCKNDTRVPVSEAEQLVTKLRERGIDVKYILLRDEGHRITRISNRILVYSQMINFITDKMKEI
ncbi:MAG: S9 family peptidase [Desulfurococcales archaeon]|nr:S9 family peptidase [Desulfurococcales archaeon]